MNLVKNLMNNLIIKETTCKLKKYLSVNVLQAKGGWQGKKKSLSKENST